MKKTRHPKYSWHVIWDVIGVFSVAFYVVSVCTAIYHVLWIAHTQMQGTVSYPNVVELLVPLIVVAYYGGRSRKLNLWEVAMVAALAAATVIWFSGLYVNRAFLIQ